MFVFLSIFLAGESLMGTGLKKKKKKKKTKQTKKTKKPKKQKTKQNKNKNLLWGKKLLQKETCQTHNGLDRDMPMDELF